MDLPTALKELLVHEDMPLGPLTTLGTGGAAPWVVEPRSRRELILAVKELSAAGLPFRMLGGGSNLFVADGGVDEIVIVTRSMQGIYHHGEEGRDHALRVEAGATTPRLVSACRDLKLSGVEPLIGIPGTVGGAVAGNAGGRHGWIGELVSEVTIALPDGEVEIVATKPEDFGYRTSPFKGRVIVDCVLELRPDSKDAIFARMTEVLREKRDSQPLAARSAGCMFRNPFRRASGKLIEEAGCKGMSVGEAMVSERHANFVVNRGGATSADVAALLKMVQAKVVAASGEELELEVETWGDVGV